MNRKLLIALIALLATVVVVNAAIIIIPWSFVGDRKETMVNHLQDSVYEVQKADGTICYIVVWNDSVAISCIR